MYAFGMLGSYFSQGVYAVAGPFQGAVDIIVVQQEDGSFKSSPWYVKCGDFQGVLKRKEKIVDISVNGVPANFFMLLNSRGEAYFEKEVEDAVLALPGTSSSAEGFEENKNPSTSSSAEGIEENKIFEGHKNSKVVTVEEGPQPQFIITAESSGPTGGESIDQIKDRSDDLVSKTALEVQNPLNTVVGLSNSSGVQPSSNLTHQSTGLQDSDKASAINSSSAEGVDENNKLEGLRNLKAMAVVEGSQAQCICTEDANVLFQGKSIGQIKGRSDDLISEVQEPQSTVEQLFDSSADQSSSNLMHQGNHLDQIEDRVDNLVSETASEVQEPLSAVNQLSNSLVDQSSSDSINQSSVPKEADDVDKARRNAASSGSTSCLNAADKSASLVQMAEDTFELVQPSKVSCMVVNVGGENLVLAEAGSILSRQLADEGSSQLQQAPKVDPDVRTGKDGGLLEVEDQDLNTDTRSSGIDGAVSCGYNTVITEDSMGSLNSESADAAVHLQNDLEMSDCKTMDELIWNDFEIVTAEDEKHLHDALQTTPVIGVCIDCESLIPEMVDGETHDLGDSSVWVSDAMVGDVASNLAVASMEGSIPMQAKNGDASKDEVTSDKNVVCKVEDGPPTEGNKAAEISAIAVVSPPSRWTMWPLTSIRSRVGKASVSEAADTKQALLAATNIAVGSPLTQEILKKHGYHELPQKPKIRSYVPTSAQIESLKLKDGPNKVTFTFPRVLGRTQVDANIYLWNWNTRIVISDVDGTITKSDVLGQFMPLVGRDWSQSGVTRLFTAIKENGYEVLFLSARAISQAYLTRQFLNNLKQDGETLPEGPVFISPDGIIPSLYREVVRRAPHEFKISCLEGIRRLFPNDVNPFYAGFGNRDTDEISYLKVGIPKGKIFIINPKGEVMVNHHVDAKSYTSIHGLVDDMFPPVYSLEQEDFNTWNYWKLPLPDIVDELSATSLKAKKGSKK